MIGTSNVNNYNSNIEYMIFSNLKLHKMSVSIKDDLLKTISTIKDINKINEIIDDKISTVVAEKNNTEIKLHKYFLAKELK